MTTARSGRVSAIVRAVVAGLCAWAVVMLSPAAPSADGPPAPAPAPPQQSPPPPPPASGDGQQPVFRGGVGFVSVDVYPRRDGHVVEGLTKDDFEVFEDGQAQTIESFEFVHIDPNPLDADRRDPVDEADALRQIADPRNRLFVVFLDLAHTTVPGSHDARQPIVDFLTRTIGARDLFGVMTPELSVTDIVFARRTEMLEGQLARYWTWGQADRRIVPRTPYEQNLETCSRGSMPDLGDLLVSLAREEALQDSLEGLVRRLGDLRDERKNILFISEGWVPSRPRPELLQTSQGDVPSIGIGTPTENRLGQGQRQQGNSSRSWCEEQMGRLALTDFDQRFKDLVIAANRANVSFYPVDVGGLRVGGVADASARASSRQVLAASVVSRDALETLRTMADATDGLTIANTNDLSGGVRRISDDLASYYLLGYTSSQPETDGRYRRIEVKVREPGIRVSARRGYFAGRAPATAVATAESAPDPVADGLARLGRIRADAEVFTYAVPGPAGLDVFVELAPGAATSAQWADGADVAVAASADGGAALAGTGHIEAGHRGVVVAVPGEAAATARWRVDVTVRSRSGSTQDRVEVSSTPATLAGEPRLYRGRTPLRAPISPVADFQFARTERLHAEWEVLSPAAELTGHVLDRTGAPLGPDLPVARKAEADGRTMAVLDLPLASFAAGDYVLELRASGPGGVTERRLAAFRVTR